MVLDVEWLMDKFNFDLSLAARLGGRSAPRTHRGKERFPGMTISQVVPSEVSLWTAGREQQASSGEGA